MVASQLTVAGFAVAAFLIPSRPDIVTVVLLGLIISCLILCVIMMYRKTRRQRPLVSDKTSSDQIRKLRRDCQTKSTRGNDISPNEHPNNDAKDLLRNSSGPSPGYINSMNLNHLATSTTVNTMKSQMHKSIHHAICGRCRNSHDGHAPTLAEVKCTAKKPHRNGTKRAEKYRHVNASRRCCSERTLTICNDEYTQAVARSKRKSASECNVRTSLGDSEKHARHSETDDCVKHHRHSKLDDCEKHVRHSKLDDGEKHARHSKLDDGVKHDKHSKLDDCMKHVRHSKLDDRVKHIRHGKLDDNAKHLRHHQHDIPTYIGNTKSADSVDICPDKDNDWQRIWLHIKPFGRRMPHGLTDESRYASDNQTGDDSCIPDKYNVDKIMCGHCLPDDRFSSTSRAQVGASGSGNDLAKIRGSLQHSPRMHSGLRSRKERNTNQNNHCVNRKLARGKNNQFTDRKTTVNQLFHNTYRIDRQHDNLKKDNITIDNRTWDNTNNSNNRRRYYTSDETDTDSDCLMTSQACYDSIVPSAAMQQRGPANQHQQLGYKEQVHGQRRDHYSNYCVDRYYHARASTDDDNYFSNRENTKQTTPLINGSDNHNIYFGDEDAPHYSDHRVSVDDRHTMVSSTAGPQQGQRLLRGEPVIVARVIKDLCTLLDYNQNGVDQKLVNAVAITVNNLPVARHILYQVFRTANHYATMHSDVVDTPGASRLPRQTISRMEQGLMKRASLPQLAASFDSVGMKLALTSLTRGIRTVAYQLLNILTELEMAQTSTDGQIMASIHDGDASTDLLRRLLIDFMDSDEFGQQDSSPQYRSTQSEFDDQSDDLDVWYDETSLTFPSSRPRHNKDQGLTSANNNNPAEIHDHTLKGIITDLTKVKTLANDAVEDSRKIKTDGWQGYADANNPTDAKSSKMAVALSAWQRRVNEYVFKRSSAVTVPDVLRPRTIAISYRQRTSIGDFQRFVPMWFIYSILIALTLLSIFFLIACVVMTRPLIVEEGHFWQFATLCSAAFDIILLQPLKVLAFVAYFTTRNKLL